MNKRRHGQAADRDRAVAEVAIVLGARSGRQVEDGAELARPTGLERGGELAALLSLAPSPTECSGLAVSVRLASSQDGGVQYPTKSPAARKFVRMLLACINIISSTLRLPQGALKLFRDASSSHLHILRVQPCYPLPAASPPRAVHISPQLPAVQTFRAPTTSGSGPPQKAPSSNTPGSSL